ncbi:MAG: hypothetical protein DDT25_01359 [Chloroflexi bacterium]|nr:hypothetical protein [Chloroflexota bacterium]
MGANFFTVAGATAVTNAAGSGVVIAVFPATAPRVAQPVVSVAATTVTGTLEPAVLRLRVPLAAGILLERGVVNTSAVRPEIEGTAAWKWQLRVEDTKVLNKGHMTDGATRLIHSMVIMATGTPPVSLATPGGVLLASGKGPGTVNAELRQFVELADVSGRFGITVTFILIPVF